MTKHDLPQIALHIQLTSISECAELLPIFTNDDNIKYTNFKHYDSLDSFQVFMEKFLSINKNEPLQYGPYSIYYNNTIIGLCGLQQKDLNAGSAELWYILNQPYWGKGLAKAAIRFIMQQCKTNTLLHTIYAEAVATNVASWKILEQTGFIRLNEIADGFSNNNLKGDLFCYGCTDFK